LLRAAFAIKCPQDDEDGGNGGTDEYALIAGGQAGA